MTAGLDELAEALAQLFLDRSSPSACIRLDGSTVTTLHHPLGRKNISAHVAGSRRFGAIPFADPERVGWACIDLDVVKWGLGPDDPDTWTIVNAIVEKLALRGIRAYLERSKGKGWHLWIFFGALVLARDVRALLVPIALEAGAQDETDLVCPRGDRAEVGNGTFLPNFGGDNGPFTRLYSYDADSEDWVEADDQMAVLREAIAHPTPAEAVPSAQTNDGGETQGATDRERGSKHPCDWIIEELREHEIELSGLVYGNDKIQFECPLHVAKNSRTRGGSAVIWSDGHGHCSSARCNRKWKTNAEFVELLGKQSHSQRERKRWQLLWAEDADGTRGADYVVDDLIHAGTVGEVYGAHGTLKTALLLFLAACIARGKPCYDRKVRKGIVIYVAAEGSGGIERRLAAVRKECPDLPARSLVVVRSALNLLSSQEVEDFLVQMEEEVLPGLDGDIVLIVFDTLSQSIPGGDENAAADLTLVESNVRTLINRVGTRQNGPAPAAALVHHVGKDVTKGPRGHSSQTGNLDWLLATERADSGDVPLNSRLFSVRAVKVKDGLDGVRWAYRGELVSVGVREEDGKLLMAPVVREADVDDLSAAKRSGGTGYQPKPGSWPDRVIAALERLHVRDGPRYVPNEILERSGYLAELEAFGGDDEPVEGFLRVEVRSYLKEAHPEAHEKRDTHRRIREAIERLQEQKQLMVYGDWLWWRCVG